MAMHIHSSFSEYQGSMAAQLWQATQNAVNVLWWTDHNQRMNWLNYRNIVHFTSLTAEQPAAGEGNPWKWQQRKSGPLSSSSGGIVQSPSSPSDPVSGGALSLSALSSSSSPAAFGYYASAPDLNYSGNLSGQTLTIDVLLNQGWSSGHLELLIGTSQYPASGGRAPGQYSLSYRAVPMHHPASRSANGNQGIVVIPMPADGSTWTTVTVTPSDDIAALWPDVDSRDFASYQLTLNAVSTGQKVSGCFDYLRFSRTTSGELFLQQQQSIGSALAATYPAVTQQQGMEVSLDPGETHLNWFGGQVAVQGYGEMTGPQWQAYLAGTAVPLIHQGGGVASYNHAYGVSNPGLLSQPAQDALLEQIATALLGNGALGCDLLEVGYVQRAGVDLAHHVGLWDVMSRNAIFLTGNGVSDDHTGNDWATLLNNWVTSAWAASTAQPDLLAALAAGRVYCGSLSAPDVALDLEVDGEVPMGAVSVSSVTSRSLTLAAAGLPAGWSVQVMQGAVDYAGTANPVPDTVQVGSFGSADLVNGQATMALDTTEGCFARTQVADENGTIQALSQPVWLLAAPPPNGIPAARQA